MRIPRPPRRTNIGAPLIALAEKGHLTPEHLQHIRVRMDKFHTRIMEDLWTEGDDLPIQREEISEALSDAFLLMQQGLEQLTRSLKEPSQDPVRMARLLLEKAEDEYLWLLQEIRRGEGNLGRGQRSTDLWGRLLTALESCPPDEIPRLLFRYEIFLQQHLEGTQRDFRRALACLPEAPQEGKQKLQRSLQRLSEFLGVQPAGEVL